MTREELESLGFTDASLDAEWSKLYPGVPTRLADMPDGTLSRTIRRERFDEVWRSFQGATVALDNEPLGSFAVDDPAVHASFKDKK